MVGIVYDDTLLILDHKYNVETKCHLMPINSYFHVKKNCQQKYPKSWMPWPEYLTVNTSADE